MAQEAAREALLFASSVAVDRNDTIWIANCGGGVYAYAPGGTKRLRGLRAQYGACLVASDPSGNLYVVDGYTRIEVYAPGKKPGEMKLLRVIHDDVSTAIALAFGPSGELYVANFPSSSGGDGSVSVYASGASEPERTITEGIKQPWGIAADEKGRLYVASAEESWRKRDGWIGVYAPGADKPERYIRRGVNGPLALALDPDGDLYAGNTYAKVAVYQPGGSRPIHELATGVADPSTLAIGF